MKQTDLLKINAIVILAINSFSTLSFSEVIDSEMENLTISNNASVHAPNANLGNDYFQQAMSLVNNGTARQNRDEYDSLIQQAADAGHPVARRMCGYELGQ